MFPSPSGVQLEATPRAFLVGHQCSIAPVHRGLVDETPMTLQLQKGVDSAASENDLK